MAFLDLNDAIHQGGGSACSWCNHRHALPIGGRAVWSWRVDGEYGEFTLRLMASPMARMVLMESSPRPPRVSATIGMKVTPTDLHACKWAVSLS